MRADSASSAVDDEIIRSLFATSSDEEKLRAIDHAVAREATSLEVRSAIRRISISSSSAEVRGAARFALVKLQSLAPPTKPDPFNSPEGDVAGRLRKWAPKEAIEDVNEPAIDEQVMQTGGLKSRLANIKLPGARRPEEVTVVEVAAPPELEAPTKVDNTMPIPELPQAELKIAEELPVTMAPLPVVPAPNTMPAPEKINSPAMPPLTEEQDPNAPATNLADKLKAWRVVRKPTPEEMMNGMKEEGEVATASEVPVPTLLHEPTPAQNVSAPVPIMPPKKEAFIREEPKAAYQMPMATAAPALPPAASIAHTESPTLAPVSRPIPRAASLDRRSGMASPPVASNAPPMASPTTPPTAAAMASSGKLAPPPTAVADAPTPLATDSETAPAVASTSLEESLKVPRIALDQIPRDLGERKRKSRMMLEEGRQAVKSGDLAAAETILFQVREFAVEYGRFQFSPDVLEREISQARAQLRRDAAMQTAAKEAGGTVR